jgi:hypothetical protein
MATAKRGIAEIIQKGVLLFSEIVPFPASSLVAAVSAAAIAKMVGLHKEHVSEILSTELFPEHFSYVEPDEEALFRFYRDNQLFPDLATEFTEEIAAHDSQKLRRIYPFLYNALILKKQVPTLLFHKQIEQRQYRSLAANYEALAHGYAEIKGDVKIERQINHFATDLLKVLNDIYAASEDELRTPGNHLIFDVIDYIREFAEA